MSSSPRGICLIINNVNFQISGYLDGAEADGNMLKDLFQELDFCVVYRQDLTRDEIRETARQYAADDHSQFDAFVFFILSHGGQKDVIYGVDDRSICVTELMCLFKPDCCPSLQSKPKLFFIETCRGRYRGLKPAAGETSSQSVSPTINSDTALANTSYPQEADFLLAFSTAPGYKANVGRKGSWFTRVSLKW